MERQYIPLSQEKGGSRKFLQFLFSKAYIKHFEPTGVFGMLWEK